VSFLLLLAAAAGVPVQGSVVPVQSIIEAPGPSGPLQATMLSPAKSGVPLVLIIPGSGPTDRDGNNPLGVKAGTYKLLAEGLAERGIATVRIDKRGMFGSKEAIVDANAVTISDYADDVHSWVDTARHRAGVPCVWVLGHSEGGLVALAAAQKPKNICGLLLVSTPGRPVGEVLREQLKANPANAPILDQALMAIQKLEQGEPLDASTLHPAIQPMFGTRIQKFMTSLLSYDPAKLLGDYAGPVLILQGQRDIQVAEEDARRLKEAARQATLTLLPDTNHTLKTVASDDRSANLATYADPALPLAPGVIDAIANFVSGATTRK